LEQLRIRVEQKQKEKSTPTREEAPTGETMHIMSHNTGDVRVNFIITPETFIDEEIAHRRLKYIERLDLALPKIPTKAMYKLQVSVAQEIQSKARSDATNL
jgi:hypothetical protein